MLLEIIGSFLITFLIGIKILSEWKIESNTRQKIQLIVEKEETNEWEIQISAFSGLSMDSILFLKILRQFTVYLERISHRNRKDVRMVLGILTSTDTPSVWKVAAMNWFYVAQAFWVLHPEEHMIPFTIAEEGSRSLSF